MSLSCRGGHPAGTVGGKGVGEESTAWWAQHVPHSSNSPAGRGGPPPEEGFTPREQHKSWDPNCCLLVSLIKADLHFCERLAADRKANGNWAG